MRQHLLAVAGCVLLSSSAIGAQAPVPPLGDSVPAYRLRLLGVYDTENGTAISGAEITNLQTGVSTATNASGLVRLLLLPDGGGLVRIRKVGYTPVTQFVTISPKDTAPVTELMSKAVPTLPTVTTSDSSPAYVSMGLRGFEQRRHEGWGHFITEAELRKKDNFAFTTIVRQLPGLMVNCVPRSPYQCYAVSSRKLCGVTVLLDGNAQTSVDLTRMQTQDFGAVEFYASALEAPAQFAGGASCGVLLLWTRER